MASGSGCLQPLRVTAIGMGRGHVFVEGVTGVVAPGKLVVDHSLAVALGVLAPVWGKLRLYVHLMIGPSGSKGRTGAAAGLLGPPPRTMATFVVTRLTATGRVADAPIPASPGRSGICLRNQAARTDGAMRWAADHDGSPPEDVCAGNPGRCSRVERTFRCQWPAAPGYYHGPAGKGMRRFNYRTKTAVDRSERKPGRRNAGNDGGSIGANHCRA